MNASMIPLPCKVWRQHLFSSSDVLWVTSLPSGASSSREVDYINRPAGNRVHRLARMRSIALADALLRMDPRDDHIARGSILRWLADAMCVGDQ